MRRAAISIDVDPSWVYRGIHGIPGPEPEIDPLYTVGLERFLELLSEFSAPATLFVVGKDVTKAARGLEMARDLGCELACHSYSHDHRLSEWSRMAIEVELDQAKIAIEAVSQQPVRGFRAPGYNVSPTLLECVLDRGWYDSSLLPAPGYFAARAAVLGAYGTLGRKSHSRPGDPRQFLGPLSAYRTTPSRPWKAVSRGALVELPMAVDPWTRLWIIGTTLATLPANVVMPAAQRAFAQNHVVLEFHAIDFVDRTDDPSLEALASKQPDLRVSYGQKQKRYRSALRALANGTVFTTLARMADTV